MNIADELRPESIIDLCCGTGHQLKLLKKQGFDNLTCVDFSEEMLRTAAQGVNAPDCLYADAADTGLLSDSADLVIISLALHEKPAEKGAAVLKEAHRILKPGAVLLIADYTADGSVPLVASAVIRFIEFLAGSEHYANYRNYISRGGLESLIDATAFTSAARYPVAMGGITVEELIKQDGHK